jgi:hypothetical protein
MQIVGTSLARCINAVLQIYNKQVDSEPQILHSAFN